LTFVGVVRQSIGTYASARRGLVGGMSREKWFANDRHEKEKEQESVNARIQVGARPSAHSGVA
jgi:hypothetical protein